MLTSLPPRLRAPAVMAVGAVAVLVVVGLAQSWSDALAVLPVAVLAVAGYWFWSGRDSDQAAALREEPDERQAALLLQVQALVGQVMSLAVFAFYLVALALHLTLWPFAVLVCLPALTSVAAWRLHREPAGF